MAEDNIDDKEGTFKPYPDIHEPDFNDTIFWKKEFNKTMYGSDFQYSKSEELCSKGEFRMQNHQEFVRNFVSPETPYNGILLFHGTGVGKTCAAIGITEGLRDYVHKEGKKIYILSSENIRPNFYKELYSEERESTEKEYHSIPGSYQCAGNKYYVDGYHTSVSKKRTVKSMIKQYYEFFGFGEFANFVDIGLGAKSPRNEDGNYLKKPKITNPDGSAVDIGEFFANSVIVIDEAHGIASNAAAKKSKDDDDTDEEPEDASDLSKSSKLKAKAKPKKNAKAKPKKKAKSDESDDEDVHDDSEGDDDDEVEIDGKRQRIVSKRNLYNVLMADSEDPAEQGIIARCRALGAKLKIILLTATPMKDNVEEMTNLLELLNKNDGHDPSAEFGPGWRGKLFPDGIVDSYDPTDITSSYNVDMLKKLSRGYISYVKGDNPITFPMALLPDEHYQIEGEDPVLYEPGHLKDPDVPGSGFMLPYRDYTGATKDINIMDDFVIKLGTEGQYFQFNLVNCPMALYQFQAYISLLKNKLVDKKIDGADTYAKMISNVAFPMVDRSDLGLFAEHNLEKIYGNKGFAEAFISDTVTLPSTTKVKKVWKCYKYKDKIFEEYGHWLMTDNIVKDKGHYSLGYFSQKLHKLVNFINSSPGIAYVYSEFVQVGAVITALALEANGYIRYTPELFTKHITESTGLPHHNITETHPQCKILHSKDPALAHHYRCTHCGELYDLCDKKATADGGKHPEGKFKVATYVIVTGKTGGIKEIDYVTTGNQAGDKIKVVIGTQVTGQGVDLKWIRQVHILDPWHNNTRIFQAIGRGLRHCSHADLAADARNVTIFKYASSPLIYNGNEWIEEGKVTPDNVSYMLDEYIDEEAELQYRDLLTETVDEHMYRRVVRKDILIKSIERSLKEGAMDCELNKMRNQFTKGGDKDYSRNCDYTKCEYSCDSQHIEYIRKITRSKVAKGEEPSWTIITGDNEEVDDFESYYGLGVQTLHDISAIKQNIGSDLPEGATNQQVWDYYRSKAYKIIDDVDYDTLLLDLPFGTIDSSTYDIYFTAPQVDKAIKIITRLFHSVHAMSLKKIVYLVKKSNPTLESKFVYVAVNKLVGHPPFVRPYKVVDKFGRAGFIIVHNSLYIYQPYELTDKRIPMYYRQQPITIKRRFYNMNDLAPKTLVQGQQGEVAVNTADLDALLDNIMSADLTTAIELVAIHIDLDDLLMREHMYVLQKAMVEMLDKENLAYLLEYYLKSGAAYFYPYTTIDQQGDGTIATMLDKLRSGEATLAHVMLPGTIEDVMIFGNDKEWKKKNLSSLLDLEFLLSGKHDASEEEGSYKNIMYPTVKGPARVVYPELNTVPSGQEIEEGATVMYGFISKAAGRMEQHHNESGSTIFKRINRHYKEYPTRKDLLDKAAFKILDHERYTAVMTLSQAKSKKSSLRGLACGSIHVDVASSTYKRLMGILEDNYDEYILNTDYMYEPMYEDVTGFMTALNNTNNRLSLCNKLERVIRILDYYLILGKKWFLNPIEVEFYRPSAEPAAPKLKAK